MYYIASLILLEITLFFTNYQIGTYLIGWDNIMPEFNLSLNFWRAVTGLWQEYRGLGLVDGMAHAANLLHTVYIWILSTFLPQSVLRYSYIHLTHLIGGIAFFFLAKKIINNEKAAFLGSIFYMFNLGVIQMYFAPLEVFATHFSTLPILALLIYKALHQPNKKHFAFLFFAVVLTTPQSFVPTVFIASCVLFFFLLVTHYLSHRGGKNIFFVILILLFGNGFWLFPYLYSAIYTPQIIANSRINKFSSEEIFYRNQARGDITSVAFLKGFMVDSVEYDVKSHKYIFFMDTWKRHQSTILYNISFILCLGVTIFGLINAAKQQNITLLPYLLTFLTAFFFLANDTPIIGPLNTALRSYFPLFGEAFRFPFTKFITLFAFCFSIFFTYGMTTFLKQLKGVQKFEKLVFFVTLTIIFCLAYPSFLGNFTSPLLRLKIPNDYNLTFNYLQIQNPNSRTALLPAYTFWNWQYRDWGHRGSGFLWYGIQQPLLKRAFDPWSNFNEQFYNQLAYAIETENKILMDNVLDKYDIGFLLLDQHIVNITSNQLINYPRIKKFLAENARIKEKKVFGKIIIYEISKSSPSIYSLSEKTPRVPSDLFFNNTDVIFTNENNYVEDKKNPNIEYPFSSLYTERLQKDIQFKTQNTNLHLILSRKIGSLPKDKKYTIQLPSLFAHEFLIPVSITAHNNVIQLTPLYPKISIDNKETPVNSSPITISSRVQNPKNITFQDVNFTVSLSENGKKSYLLNKYPNVLKISNGKIEETIIIDTKNVTTAPLTVNLEKIPKSITIAIEKFINPFNQENIIDKKLYTLKTSTQNSVLHPFSDNYATVATDPLTKGITLSAKTDAQELTFYKDSLFHQASYLLLITTDYKSGLPISFSVDNPFENKVELETRLSKEQKENIIILPPRENYFKGYGFHFVVKSVGKEIAQSTINSIDLFPIPAETIKNIKISAIDTPSTLSSSEKKPVKFQKLSSFLYVVSPYPNSQYIALSQAYQEGWKMYQIKNYESGIMKYAAKTLPFLFGTEIKDHILVNNWANGWLLPTNNQQSQSSLAIVFLPQYLEYAGFITLFGVLVWFVIPWLKEALRRIMKYAPTILKDR